MQPIPYGVRGAALLLGAAFLVWTLSAAAQECGLPSTAPEKVGFSAARLKKLEEGMHAAVDENILPNVVYAVARHGKVVDCDSYGLQDLERKTPVRKDTLFRIASMTKAVTAVAMMILYEEGKWQPADPVERYIPELAKLKVFAGEDANGKMIVEETKHPPTIDELMMHSAGLTYGFFSTPIDKLYKDAHLFDSKSNLQEFVTKLGKIPLLYQPGERWDYSVASDVQGLLVERLSGKSLAEFLEERIFTPLKMTDTAFYVPEKKFARLATAYKTDEAGNMKAIPVDPEEQVQPTFLEGGGGLFSTIHDYLRFCQMLLNGGELDGARILAPSSVRLMRGNHLPDRLLGGGFHILSYEMQPGQGFGYGGAVIEDPVRLATSVGKDTFLWVGYWGSWFWIDPTNDVVFVAMTQRANTYAPVDRHRYVSRALTYQALLRP